MEPKIANHPTEPIVRESCVIYRSHYEAAQVLPPVERLALYEATFQYGLNGIAPDGLSDFAQALFTCIKPLLDANKEVRECFERGQIRSSGGRTRQERRPASERRGGQITPLMFLSRLTSNDAVYEKQTNTC